jgi:hypothetical protein
VVLLPFDFGVGGDYGEGRDMRKFFLLSYQAYGDDIWTVEPGYKAGTFNDTRLYHCNRVPDNYLEGVSLRVTAGKPCDFVPNPMLWPIVSPKMLGIFQKFGPEMQVLDAQFVDQSGQQVLTDYKVLNILQCLTGALDLNLSTTSYTTVLGQRLLNVMEFVFRQEAIPSTVHIFKVAEAISDVVVSADFARVVREAKMPEVAFIKTRTV